MHIKMVVSGLTIDPNNNAPIVILREEAAGRLLPIWIGVIEASAIAFELEKVQLARPMTHDLLRSTVEALGGRVQRVMIVDLRDNTYYAAVVLAQDERLIEIDARPSDAIALAMRAAAPIYCESTIIDRIGERDHLEMASPASLAPPVKLEDVEYGDEGPRPIIALGKGASMEEFLENLGPEDFGKYKM